MIKETEVYEEFDIFKWKQLKNQVFEKYKDEEEYYFSATGCYRSLEKTYFSVNYIVPLSKGGQTKLDNLQLVAKWESGKKEDKVSLDILEEQLKHDKNCKENINKKQAIIDEIFQQDENNIIALGEMADIEFDNGNYEESLKYCNRILEVESFNEHVLTVKSFSCFEVKNYQEYKESTEKLIEIEETSFRLMELGNCYVVMKENDKAIYYYNKAMEKDIDNEYEIDLNYYIGNAYYAKKEYEEALKYFEEVLKRDCEHLCALNDMGACLYKLDRFKDALHVFEKASSLAPNRLAFHRNIELVKKKI